MRIVKKIFESFILREQKKAFYLAVKCSDCGEEVKVRINRASDFQIEYSPKNPEHRYIIKKEIIGKGCFNLMKLTIALTKNAQVLFTDAKSCKFIVFDRE